MGKETLLMIFVRNPELGKVKTRLAKTVGNVNALEIYKKLLEHTGKVCIGVPSKRIVFYSDYIDEYDCFDNVKFYKKLQSGDSLGERMKNAFLWGFNNGFKRVIIIGSDCYQINSGIVAEALETLKSNDFTIGPATDGGYYLLGMKTLYPQVFENKKWSSENVLLDTLLDIKKLNKTVHMLPTLSDVDFEEDLGELRKFLSN